MALFALAYPLILAAIIRGIAHLAYERGRARQDAAVRAELARVERPRAAAVFARECRRVGIAL